MSPAEFPISPASTACSAGSSGFQIVAVPGLIPDDSFFDHLANRPFSGDLVDSRRKRTRLSRRAGCFSRFLRPCAAARASGVCGIHGRIWQGRPARSRDERDAAAVAAVLVHHRIRPDPHWRTACACTAREFSRRAAKPFMRSTAASRTASVSISNAFCPRNTGSMRFRRPISSSTVSSSCLPKPTSPLRRSMSVCAARRPVRTNAVLPRRPGASPRQHFGKDFLMAKFVSFPAHRRPGVTSGACRSAAGNL